MTNVDLTANWKSPERLVNAMHSDDHTVNMWNDHINAYPLVPKLPRSLNIHDWVSWLFFPNSWQLTLDGHIFMCKTFSNYYVHKHNENYKQTGRLLINLSRIVNGPWYIINGKLFVWNHYAHFELSMLEGNVHDYVNLHVPK